MCQGVIFTQNLSHGKIHDPQKSRKSVEGRRIVLCEPAMYIHRPLFLWITPVDKPVENVENSEFSTGIPGISFYTPPCGEGCIPLCITAQPRRKNACYVTAGGRSSLDKSLRKSLQIVKKSCTVFFPPVPWRKFFVKNRQKICGRHRAGKTSRSGQHSFTIFLWLSGFLPPQRQIPHRRSTVRDMAISIRIVRMKGKENLITFY